MKKDYFYKIFNNTRNQFLIITKDKKFFINMRKKLIINDLGVIAINEDTGTPAIVLFNEITTIIVDGKTFT